MTKLLTALLATFLTNSVAVADCSVWAFEDTSAASQKRARAFVSANTTSMENSAAQGLVIAKWLATTHRLDYVDVFMTRPQDGQYRNDHSTMSSTIHVKYNPGNTPLNGGKRLLADALADPEGAKFEHGILGWERVKLSEDHLEQIAAEFSGEIDAECTYGSN